MKVFELYKKGMPFRATFYLFLGVCGAIVALGSIPSFIIGGIIMGSFFAYLGFSWLPSLYLEDEEQPKNKTISQEKNQSEAVNTSKIEEPPAVNTTPKIEEKPETEVEKGESDTIVSSGEDKNMATAEELSDDFVLITYKKHRCYMSQNTSKTLESMPKKDNAGHFLTSGARAKIFEAFVNFKPIIREGDGRHVIKPDHYDMFDTYGYHNCDYFMLLDDSFMKEQVIPYLTDFHNPAVHAEYLKVKVNKRYEKKLDDGSTKYYVELADLTDKYIFDEQIEVKEENYDYYEVGKECALVRIGWGVYFEDMNVYIAAKLEDIEKYIRK